MTTRRAFLSGALALGAAAPVARARSSQGSAPAFLHGVASGDPLPDGVVLWTRVTTSRPEVEVRWVVATDPGLRSVVRSGTVATDGSRDHTVKVDVRGLRSGTTLFYGFRCGPARSVVGRTRTAASARLDRARFAVITCGDATRGLFNAYARVAELPALDAVVHLGDAIYETGRTDRVRPADPPREIRTLADYRRRWASYREDPAQAACYAAHPVVWVWDDHETCDGTWRGGADPSDHDDAEDGPFARRKGAALQAALEWMPIRTPDHAQPERIYRSFRFGDLVDLVMLDTRRIGRDEQLPGNVEGDFFTRTGGFADPARQLLGAEQERWLEATLSRSRTAWRLLGNQVVVSAIKVAGLPNAAGGGIYANPDQWDGYPAAQDRLYALLERTADTVVLTGDVHASMAFEVTRDPNDPASYDPVTGRGVLAPELVAPSLSSAGDPQEPGPDDPEGALEALLAGNSAVLQVPNPHLRYVEATRNGYLLLDVDRSRVRAEFWHVPTVLSPTEEQALDAAFTVERGSPRLLPA